MKTFFLELGNRNRLKYIFKKIIKVKNNKVILNCNLEKIKFEKKIKIVEKIKNIINNNKCKQLCIQESIKNDKELVNLLYSYNINICNPKWLFKQIINEVVEKAIEEKEKEEISLCINELDEKIEKSIYKFAKEFKRLNIITNHIGRFKKIEENLYQQNGILITISNNKRKSLSKAKLIVNYDFPKEILNKFNIYDEAIIINLEDEIRVLKKRFNGKIIDDYKYIFNEHDIIDEFIKENKLEGYDKRDICQAIEFVPKGNVEI